MTYRPAGAAGRCARLARGAVRAGGEAGAGGAGPRRAGSLATDGDGHDPQAGLGRGRGDAGPKDAAAARGDRPRPDGHGRAGRIDPQVLAKARWALRRLEGQADPQQLRAFLGLHRITRPRAGRATGDAFDATARELLLRLDDAALHLLTRAAMAVAPWPLAGLSDPEIGRGRDVCRPHRRRRSDCPALRAHGSGRAAVWRSQGGSVAARLDRWLRGGRRCPPCPCRSAARRLGRPCPD